MSGQLFTNNGSMLYIGNTEVYVDGDFLNQNNGTVDLDGKLTVNYDWTNDAANNVFINIEPIPDGVVNLFGDVTPEQRIDGISPTHFENLFLSNSANKKLYVSDCEVNGILTLNSVLELNTNKIIIDNPDPNAISYMSKYILSETNPTIGYGIVQWNIGDATNLYRVPFGTGNGKITNNLNLLLETKSQGQPNDGFISFATYPSDIYNSPLPTNSGNLNNPIEKVADRYWIIDGSSYNMSKPAVDIVFKYTFDDIDPSFNFYLDADELKAMRWNPFLGRWDDWGPFGISDQYSNTVSVIGDGATSFVGVSPLDFYENWALISSETPLTGLLTPNAFTPDGDGFNDVFIPVFHPDFIVEDYLFIIYNRWGDVIFETRDETEGWDGTGINGDKIVQIGVYSWLIVAKAVGGPSKKYTGHVTLLL